MNAMDSEKKRYTTPQLSAYGKLEEITQQGGYTSTDVPAGTPVNGNIGNVAS
jgi:hypothetical protein